MKNHLTAVVYLIRAAEGIDPIKLFVESYRNYCAGYYHDLVLVFKGFRNHEIPIDYIALFEGIPFHSHYVEDVGYAFDSFYSVYKAFDHDYFFFLHTFSRILAHDWLKIIMKHLSAPESGLVGCTGSYEVGTGGNETDFPRFPSYSLRTNAFGIKKVVIDRLEWPVCLDKVDAYKFKTGKNSLTRQIMDMSLNVLVVGRDGKSYIAKDWWMSETFRKNNQSNLLIADNQTDFYCNANENIRRNLSKDAWGVFANRSIPKPALPLNTNTEHITVLIPTYNRKAWLMRAVESVLQERRIPILLHIFDNASTDDTENYVRELMRSDSRVRYTRNPKNIGVLLNYSQALENVESEYFIPLADDDWLYPEYLFSAYEIMVREKDLGAVIFKTDQKLKDGTSIPDSSLPPERLFEGYLDPESHMRQWLKYGHYTSWSAILWKTECLKLTPRPFFKIGLPFDVDFQVRVFSHYPVWLFNKLGAVYFMHENQSSHMFDLSQLCSWAQMFQTLDIYRDKHGFFEDAEYSSLRSTAIERYRWAWNRLPKTALTKKQISATIVASAYRLGDWPLAFRLLEDLAMNEEKSVAHCSQRFVVPPIGNIALNPSEAESISRSDSFILTTITWYKIQNNRLQNAEIEINKLKHLLSMEKERLKVLKQSTNELSFVLKKLKNAIKQLYALRQWKWAAFFSSPLRHREKREFHPLHEVLSELNKVTSMIKERINPKT